MACERAHTWQVLLTLLTNGSVVCVHEGGTYPLTWCASGLQGRTWEMDSGANWQKFMNGPGYTRVVQDLHKCGPLSVILPSCECSFYIASS